MRFVEHAAGLQGLRQGVSQLANHGLRGLTRSSHASQRSGPRGVEAADRIGLCGAGRALCGCASLCSAGSPACALGARGGVSALARRALHWVLALLGCRAATGLGACACRPGCCSTL